MFEHFKKLSILEYVEMKKKKKQHKNPNAANV